MCTNGDADCCGAYVAYWHLADITTAPAKTLGLPVDIEMPKEIMELMTLYPHGLRIQGHQLHNFFGHLDVHRKTECLRRRGRDAVSYTHLTLPTNREVSISVVAVSLNKKT